MDFYQHPRSFGPEDFFNDSDEEDECSRYSAETTLEEFVEKKKVAFGEDGKESEEKDRLTNRFVSLKTLQNIEKMQSGKYKLTRVASNNDDLEFERPSTKVFKKADYPTFQRKSRFSMCDFRP